MGEISHAEFRRQIGAALLNQFRCGPAGYPSAQLKPTTIVAVVQATHAENSIDLAGR